MNQEDKQTYKINNNKTSDNIKIENLNPSSFGYDKIIKTSKDNDHRIESVQNLPHHFSPNNSSFFSKKNIVV